ncbi:MAG: hypothetical protein ACYCW6_08130 [Candidatus Xenobia bacterium]
MELAPPAELPPPAALPPGAKESGVLVAVGPPPALPPPVIPPGGVDGMLLPGVVVADVAAGGFVAAAGAAW